MGRFRPQLFGFPCLHFSDCRRGAELAGEAHLWRLSRKVEPDISTCHLPLKFDPLPPRKFPPATFPLLTNIQSYNPLPSRQNDLISKTKLACGRQKQKGGGASLFFLRTDNLVVNGGTHRWRPEFSDRRLKNQRRVCPWIRQMPSRCDAFVYKGM